MLEVKRVIYANGDKYEGSFSKGHKHGFGKMMFKNGDVYEGNWENDLQNGKGKMHYSNGEEFEGEFKDGKRKGLGKMIYKTGDINYGEWENDEENGNGKITFKNGDECEGKFVNDVWHGKITFKAGLSCIVEVSGNKLNGIFEISYKDEFKYVSEFCNNKEKNAIGKVSVFKKDIYNTTVDINNLLHIGKGGFGEVYKAFENKDKTFVVLKEIKRKKGPDAKNILLNEFKMSFHIMSLAILDYFSLAKRELKYRYLKGEIEDICIENIGSKIFLYLSGELSYENIVPILYMCNVLVFSKVNYSYLVNFKGLLLTETKEGKKCYLVYEHCNGGDLSKYLECLGQFDEELIRVVLLHVLKGLKELHSELEIVHCDIKPSNILVHFEGMSEKSVEEMREKMKAGDINIKHDIAKLLKTKAKFKLVYYGLSLQKIKSKCIKCRGTLSYMAPELIVYEGKTGSEKEFNLVDYFGFSRESKIVDYTLSAFSIFQSLKKSFTEKFTTIKDEDKSIDIWALGVLAYQLHWNDLPFKGKCFDELKANIMKGKYEICLGNNNKVSYSFVNFLLKCLQKESKKRMNVVDLLDKDDFITGKGSENKDHFINEKNVDKKLFLFEKCVEIKEDTIILCIDDSLGNDNNDKSNDDNNTNEEENISNDCDTDKFNSSNDNENLFSLYE